MAVISEIVTKFVFKGNTSALTKFNKDSKSGISNAKKFGAAAIALGGAFTRIGVKALNSGEKMNQFLERTGTSSKRFEEMRSAALRTGASFGVFKDAAFSIHNALQQTALTGDTSFFSQMGVDVYDSKGQIKDFITVLHEMRRALSGGIALPTLTKNQQAQFLANNGIDASLINLFKLNDAGYAKNINDDVNYLDKEELADSNRATAAGNVKKQSKEALSNDIGAALAPIVETWNNMMSSFYDLFDGLGGAITLVTGYLVTLAGVVLKWRKILSLGKGFLAGVRHYAKHKNPKEAFNAANNVARKDARHINSQKWLKNPKNKGKSEADYVVEVELRPGIEVLKKAAKTALAKADSLRAAAAAKKAQGLTKESRKLYDEAHKAQNAHTAFNKSLNKARQQESLILSKGKGYTPPLSNALKLDGFSKHIMEEYGIKGVAISGILAALFGGKANSAPASVVINQDIKIKTNEAAEKIEKETSDIVKKGLKNLQENLGDGL